jgi:hypothetical protein
MGSPSRVARSILLLLAAILVGGAGAQVIEFESGGLKYKTLTHNGFTIMFAPLPLQVRDWAILQVSISNGSPVSWTVKPEDFRFEHNGRGIQALQAGTVVNLVRDHAGRNDVTKLVTAYEATLYGNAQIHSTNGYEARRQSALAEVGSTRLKAAAAASAIVLAPTKLLPGQSTDGAVFYPNNGKPLGAGQLTVHAAGEDFVFQLEVELHSTR